jgi:hypothetical protein
MMQQVAMGMVAVLFLLVAALVLLTALVAHTLKSKFPDAWAAEGEPEKWLWLQPTGSGGHIFEFLDERRYLATGSASFARLCSVARFGWYTFLVSFLVLAVGGAMVVVTRG